MGIEQIQVAGNPVAVAQISQAVAFAIGRGLCFQCSELFAQGRATRQGVGHFAEGGLDGLFVLRHGNVTPGLGGIERGDVAPHIENRQADLRQE